MGRISVFIRHEYSRTIPFHPYFFIVPCRLWLTKFRSYKPHWGKAVPFNELYTVTIYFLFISLLFVQLQLFIYLFIYSCIFIYLFIYLCVFIIILFIHFYIFLQLLCSLGYFSFFSPQVFTKWLWKLSDFLSIRTSTLEKIIWYSWRCVTN